MRLAIILMQLSWIGLFFYINVCSGRNLDSKWNKGAPGYDNVYRQLRRQNSKGISNKGPQASFGGKIQDHDDEFTKRIIGGNYTRPNKHPFMAFVLVDLGFPNGSFCGGTLIDNQFVLTAAHCVFDKDNGRIYHASQITVYLGDHEINNPEKGEVEAKVSKVVMHKYDPVTTLNDIAILVLDKPVTYTKEIQPIKLARESMYGAMNCTIAGWGFTGTSDSITKFTTLKELHVRIMERDECLKFSVTYGEICVIETENPDDPWQNVCEGDSGGPVFCQTSAGLVQAGLASHLVAIDSNFGEGKCANRGTASVYTDVAKFHWWIQSNMLFESGVWYKMDEAF